ncbi:MAG: glycosyltransferase family 4 protein, partial [Thermoplasmata archaeon]
MNILQVSGETTGRSGGGVGSVVHTISNELVTRGHQCDVISYGGSAKSSSYNIIMMGKPWLGAFHLLHLGLYSASYTLSRHEYYDVIHFHLPTCMWTLSLLAGRDEILSKSVITFHTTALGFRERYYTRCHPHFMSWSDLIHRMGYSRLETEVERLVGRRKGGRMTAVSERVREELCRYGVDSRIHLIRNPARGFPEKQDRTSPVRSEESLVLSVGRLSGQKGYHQALQALSRIKKDGMKYLVAGKGKLREKLQLVMKKWEVRGEFLGYVPDDTLHKLYSEARLFLLTSLYEGLPVAALEAMRFGLPVVGFDSAGLEEIVSRPNLGYICSFGD